jgi:hypothetical protein
MPMACDRFAKMLFMFFKRVFLQILFFSVALSFGSCSREVRYDDSIIEKTRIGLTKKEIKFLQSKYMYLTIDTAKYSNSIFGRFNSLQEAIRVIDSLEKKIFEQIRENQGFINLKNRLSNRAACPCGNYFATNISNGSLFSSFSISFEFCNNTISNGLVSTSGLTLGWTIGSQTTSYFGGSYACTTIIAQFGIGILNWNIPVHINWHFDPSRCTFYYNFGTGPCGNVL